MLPRELDGKLRPAQIKLPCYEKTYRHHQRRQYGDEIRNMMHVLEQVIALGKFERVAEEFLHPWPAKSSANGNPEKIDPAARNARGISITSGLSRACSH